MDRVLAAEAIGRVGEKVTVAGWVHRVRNLGGVSFVVLRDRSGIIQVVSDGAADIAAESVVRVSGTVRANEKAPGGAEIAQDTMEVMAPASADRSLCGGPPGSECLGFRGLPGLAFFELPLLSRPAPVVFAWCGGHW